MAAYTQINNTQLNDYLASFKLGPLVKFNSITSGIENTNYFVTTGLPDQPYRDYVLTLFEDLEYQELPYFVALTAHLVNYGVIVPAPVLDPHGQALKRLAGKPALLLPRFAGQHLAREDITPTICTCVGTVLAQLHQAGQSFTLQRQGHRGHRWWQKLGPMVAARLPVADRILLMDTIDDHRALLKTNPELPTGVIHGDLFHDNALFYQGKLSAIIDIYNASTDYLLFDVAIAVNDWCIDANGCIVDTLANALLLSYHQLRPFTLTEVQYWPKLLAVAAMRFWLSRLESSLGFNAHQQQHGMHTHKNPNSFRKILINHQKKCHQLPL
jgi:homoserine kinase type II